jgi:hypothetical protein
LLTARLSAKEIAALKKLMLRPGFVEEWDSLDAQAAEFAKALLAEENSIPSASYKLFTSYDPEAVLWLGFTSTDEAVRERFNLFLEVWPTNRQRLPHALMQEMRITPELPAYGEIVQAIFLEFLDGKLSTPEELRAYLEPYSPPAPPPKEVIKRPRAKRGAEARIKESSYDDDDEDSEESSDEEDLDDIGGEDDDLDLGLSLPNAGLDASLTEELGTAAAEEEGEEEEEEVRSEVAQEAAQPKRAPERTSRSKPSRTARQSTAAPLKAKEEKLTATPVASVAEVVSAPVIATESEAAHEPEKAEKPATASNSKVESRPKSKPAPAKKSASKAAKPAAKAANPKVKKSAAKKAKKI